KNAIESRSSVERPTHVRTVAAKSEDRYPIIAVTDTGHGIRDEHLKNIFRFGFTTKTDGNGFGLHSAAIAMNDMGGSIRATSGGWGTGAAFILTLPLTPIPRPEHTPSEEAPGSAAVADPSTFTGDCTR